MVPSERPMMALLAALLAVHAAAGGTDGSCASSLPTLTPVEKCRTISFIRHVSLPRPTPLPAAGP